MIEEGTFRPDLFYRLNVFRIELPPLRERREDIPPLVEHFVRKFALAMNKHVTRIAPGAMDQLQQQLWMGNVRELENAVERAMVVAQEPELREQDFIFKAQAAQAAQRRARALTRSRRRTSCAYWRSAAATRAAPRRSSTSTASRSITSSSVTAGRGLQWKLETEADEAGLNESGTSASGR